MPCGWCRKLEMQGLQTVLLLDIYTIKLMFSSKWQRCRTLSLSFTNLVLTTEWCQSCCQFPSWIAQLRSCCIMNYKFCIVFWETHAMIEKPFTVFPMQTLSFVQAAYFNMFDSMCTSQVKHSKKFLKSKHKYCYVINSIAYKISNRFMDIKDDTVNNNQE